MSLCDEQIAVTPMNTSVLPFSLITFQVSGGSGEFIFEFVANNSGGLINGATGAYLAGDFSGVSDRLIVRDLLCMTEASIEIVVVDQMQVLPPRPSVARGQSIQFDVEGGSGDYEFVWNEEVSGGQLDDNGSYFSGDTIGQDRIEVHDLQTGEIILVLIDVEARVSTSITPKMSWIPLGAHFTFQASGGSGVFDFEWRPLVNGMIAPTLTADIDQVRLDGHGIGEGILIARDRFLSIEIQARVQILASLQYQAERVGKGHRESRMLAWPDIDGDGIDELLMGVSEVDLTSSEAGGVYLYSSATQALLQRLTTEERAARYGRSMAIGDWNSDGLPDLAVGAILADRGAVDDTGAVYLYEGVATGGVNPEPAKVIYGGRGGGQSGSAVELCDFNGDGKDDLVIGAWVSEISGQANNSGILSLHLNRDGIFSDDPDQQIQGQSYQENEETGEWAWSGRVDHRIGYYLSAGDIDGDGRCDLVASSYSTRGYPNVAETGEVQVFKGMDTFGDPPLTGPDGGLTTLPVKVITESPSDANAARLGWRTLVVDRDRDGKAELIISQPRSHINASDAGAIFIYEWSELSDEPANTYLTTSDAGEQLAGSSGSEYFGYSLSAGDFDGDGNEDLAVGAYNDEISGSPSNVGSLRVFRFDEAQGAYETEPSHLMLGALNADNFGESVVILGQSQVAGYAGFDDTLGPQAGRPYWGRLITDEDGIESIERIALAFPAEVGYARFGAALDLDDIDVDGNVDVIVGASFLSPLDVPQTRAGGAFLYEIADIEGPALPQQELSGFRGHSGYDLVGESTKFIGDFDGDGFGDFAVSARADEQPTSFSTIDIIDPAGCPPRRSNTGSVYIFRGQADGTVNAEPSFVIYGELVNESLEHIGGVVDFNNDNFSDLYIGARFADTPNPNGGQKRDAGRALVYRGRPAPLAGQRAILCEPDLVIDGVNANNHLGTSVAPLGDIDGDGCGEVAFGEPEIRIGDSNRQGAVHILYGWGGAGCYTTPHISSITFRNTEARFGTSLATSDLDSDGISDIVIGGFNTNYNGIRPGAVWVVRGSQLRTLNPQALTQTRTYHEINNFVGEEGQWWVTGTVHQSRFGWSVAASGQYVFVGAPITKDRSQRIGEGYLYKMSNNGFEELAGVFAGETQSVFSEMGQVSDLHVNPFKGWIGFGSFWGRGTHSQGGSVYIGSFEP